MLIRHPAANIQKKIVTLAPVTGRDCGSLQPATAQASPLRSHAFGDLGKLCPDNERARNPHRLWNRTDLCQYPRDCESAISSRARRPSSDDGAQMVEGDVFEMRRADEE